MSTSIDRRHFIQATATGVAGLLWKSSLASSAQEEIHVCPKSSPPSRTVYAVRLTDLTTSAWDLKLTMSCLQGIVNRPQPRLYLIHDDYDELWLNWLRERGDLDEVQWLTLDRAFAQFLPEVNKAFIIDPNVPGSINVATMLASLRGGLVITPRTAYEYNLPMGHLPGSWKAGMDLTFMGWKKDIEAYRWFFKQYGSELSKKAVAVLDPHEVALRDYLVEFKIPTLWISGPADVSSHPAASPEEEKQFAREMLMKWPPNIPCLGWPGSGDEPQRGIGEWQGVRLFSECAKFELCTAYDGYSPTVGNLSVHSGTSANFQQKAAAVRLERNKIYYSFVRSDGDGWNFQRHYYRRLFDDPAHGQFPVGWQIGPTAFDGMPDVLDYYYKHARPGDCFVNALTGVGYIHEDVYAANYSPEEQHRILQDYIRLSSLYRERIDASVMSTFSEMQPERLALFVGIKGLRGVFANYGRTAVTNSDNLVTTSQGVPVFRAVNDGPSVGMPVTAYTEDDAVAFEVSDINRWTPSRRPAFLHVFLANWLTNMEMAKKIASTLGPDFVAVRPDQLVSLYRAYKGGK